MKHKYFSILAIGTMCLGALISCGGGDSSSKSELPPTASICKGINGGSFSAGQTETLNCPSGQTGSQSRACQTGGVWGGVVDNCAPQQQTGGGTGSSTEEGCGDIRDAGNLNFCCRNPKNPEYGDGNCVWYAAYRANRQWPGFYGLGRFGNARTIWTTISDLQRQTSDPNAYVNQLTESLDGDGHPHAVSNSLAINTSGTFGHIAWVESVANNQVHVMEQNCFHNDGNLLDSSFPSNIPNTSRSHPYSADYFQHYIVRGHRPRVELENQPFRTVAVGALYKIVVIARDGDNNLSRIDINWNDGSSNPVESRTVGGGIAQISFSRAFSTAQTINWSINAYDDIELISRTIRGTFQVVDTPTCLGKNDVRYAVNETERLSCPTGQTGMQMRMCQSNGTWGATTGSCSTPVTYCQGFNGGNYAAGQVETLSCPAGQTGSQSHTCQTDGNWGTITGSCDQPVVSVAKVIGLNPSILTRGTATRVYVQGENLPSTVVFALDMVVCNKDYIRSATQVSQTCIAQPGTPSSTGLVVKPAPDSSDYLINGDHFYSVSIEGVAPVVTGISPPVLRKGVQTRVYVQGENLPSTVAFALDMVVCNRDYIRSATQVSQTCIAQPGTPSSTGLVVRPVPNSSDYLINGDRYFSIAVQ